MKPKRTRSTSSRCLICVRNCPKISYPLLGEEIPGAVHCSTLQRQLQNLFILRHILEIDLTWCETTLKRRSEAEEEFNRIFDLGEDNCDPVTRGDLEFWFMLCNDCIFRVEEAWRVYQKLLAIQTQMNLIKCEIKETMKEGMRKTPNIKGDHGIDDEIRKMVHPDIEFLHDICPGDEKVFEEDQYYDDDNDDEFFPNKGEVEVEVKINTDVSQLIAQPKRNRGRPPGSGSKSKNFLTTGSRISRRYIRRKRTQIGPSSSAIRRRKKYHWWLCPQCDARYRDEDEDKIRTHQERHNKSEGMGGSEFDCPQCTFPAQDCLELDRHIRIRHINSIKKNNSVYPCPECEFKSRIWKSLKKHASENHPGLTDEDLGGQTGSLLCSECPRTFTSSRSLAAHQRALHPHLLGAEQEELQCDQCDLKFTSRIYLQAHINNVHKNVENKFMCDDCGKAFPFLSKLKRHKVTHVNKTKRIHCCEICGVDYAHKEILVKHMREIHPQNEDAVSGDQELFKCRYCPFQTPFRPALKKHTASHKEEMGFKCSQCGKCYTNAQGLKRHERINHSETQVPCPYCNRKYPSVEYMRDHMKKFCKMKELKEQQQEVTSGNIDDLIVISTESKRQRESQPHEHSHLLEYHHGQAITIMNSGTFEGKVECPVQDHQSQDQGSGITITVAQFPSI